MIEGLENLKYMLKEKEFRFKKTLGQNFIFDPNLLDSIVADAGVSHDDIVLEIGTGAGTLTQAIAKIARKVITFELDMSLDGILKETLAQFDNIEIVYKDILKLSDEQIMEYVSGAKFKVVANIPYNITSPLIMRFIESKLPVESMTIMVQKEIADRLSANPGTQEYGAITASVKLRADVHVMRNVNRKIFFPVPKVDSSVVRIDIVDKYNYKDLSLLKRLIRSAFQMRRKTFANNIMSAFSEISKDAIKDILVSVGLKEDVRGEELSVEEFILVSDKLYYYCHDRLA